MPHASNERLSKWKAVAATFGAALASTFVAPISVSAQETAAGAPPGVAEKQVRATILVRCEGVPVADVGLLIGERSQRQVLIVTDSYGRAVASMGVPLSVASLRVVPTSRGPREPPTFTPHKGEAYEIIRRYGFARWYTLVLAPARTECALDIDVVPAIQVRFVLRSPDGAGLSDGLAWSPTFPREGWHSKREPGPFVVACIPRNTATTVWTTLNDGREYPIAIPASERDVDLGTIRLPALVDPCEVRAPVTEHPTSDGTCERVEERTVLVSVDGSVVFSVGRGVSLGPCEPVGGGLLQEPIAVRVSSGRYYALNARLMDEGAVELVERIRHGEDIGALGVPTVDLKPGGATALHYSLEAAKTALERSRRAAESIPTGSQKTDK